MRESGDTQEYEGTGNEREFIEQVDELEQGASAERRLDCVHAANAQTLDDAWLHRDIPRPAGKTSKSSDSMLSPVRIDELREELDPCPSSNVLRAGDKGFLNLSTIECMQLLDGTARHTSPRKLRVTLEDCPPILERIGLHAETWCALVSQFCKLFSSRSPADLKPIRLL